MGVEDIFNDLSANHDMSIRVARGGGPSEDKVIYSFIRDNVVSVKSETALLNIDSQIRVCDYGCGCGYTAIKLSKEGVEVDFIDFPAVLDVLKSELIESSKHNFFNTHDFIFSKRNLYSVIIMYSVVQYLFVGDSCRKEKLYDFLDSAMKALKPRGRLLLGDIPDKSMRDIFKRNYPKFSGASRKDIKGYNFEIDFGLFTESFYSRILEIGEMNGCLVFIVPQSTDAAFNFIRKDLIIIKQ